MGHKHTREEIVEAALAVAAAEGLSRLSFARVGAAAGTSDRVVVYYLPTKEDLVTEVVVAVGLRLQAALDEVVHRPVADHTALLRLVWPVLTRPEHERTVALFFEANGLAAAGQAPYDELVPALVAAWVDWAAGRLTGRAERRRAEAEATIALADGLLLFRLLAGPQAADRAARRLGVG